MQKRKFDLTSDIVEVKLESPNKQSTQFDKEESKKNILISISVEEETKKEFKTWCARKGLKMNEAFIKAFNLLKKQDYT